MSSGKFAFRSVTQVFDRLAETLRLAFGATPAARLRRDAAAARRRQRLPVPLGGVSPRRPAIADLALLIHQLPPGPSSAPLRELWRALATHGGSLDALPSATLQSALESLRAPTMRPDLAAGLQHLDELLQRELLVRGRRRLDAAPAAARRRGPR